LNGNRRIRGYENGIKELKLLGITKQIGVICQISEDCVIQKFVEIEERDSQVEVVV